MLTAVLQAIAIVFLVIGALFGLLGSWGMIRLKDPMQRIHAPSKASTVGVGAVLVGGFFAFLTTTGQTEWHNILITLFLLLTAPVSALFLAKAHIFGTIDRATLPPTGVGTVWATLDRDADQDPGPATRPDPEQGI